MPKVKIDIGTDAYKNIDELSTRDGISPIIFDGFKNDAGDDVKRWGYSNFSSIGGSRVDGLFWSKFQKKLFAVSNGVAYTIDENGTSSSIGSGLEISGKVVFQDDGARVNMANGGAIYHSAAGGALTAMADADAPTEVIGLGMIDGYLLAATPTTVQFSSPLDTTDWTATDFLTPESMPDGISSLQVAYREVTMFGSDSVDVYFNDGISPFSRLDGAFIQKGVIAPNSVTRRDNFFFFLAEDKQVYILAGRDLQPISNNINREIQGYDTVSDAVGNVAVLFGKEFYILTFPTEGVTWVFDIKLQVWAAWSKWNSSLNIRESFRMHTYCYVPDWDKHLIGDITTGKIYEWSPDIYQDNGDDIRFERVTGNTMHDTYQRKRCDKVKFKVRRGIDTTVVANSREGQMMVKFRNESGGWSNEKWISLGFDGDRDIFRSLHRQGIYESRQWSITHTDSTPFILSNPIEEDVTLLSK